MLQELIIDNLALLRHVHISFKNGMTCLTGETGAGKSIMLDAIGLILGERCDPNFIAGMTSEEAKLNAVFQIEKNSQAYIWLKHNSFIAKDASDCLNLNITRIIYKTHHAIKSKITINHTSATLQHLKQLGQYLIYIHGQHEHLNLLKESKQLDTLDNCGQINNLAQEVYKIYQDWSQTKQLLTLKLAEQSEQQARKQLLEFQITELESAELKTDEWQEINQRFEWIANQEQYINKLNQVGFLLDGSSAATEDTDGVNINQQLHQILSILSNINAENKTLHNISALINQAAIQVNEASSELADFVSNLDIDPEVMQQLDQRITKLQDLARKYKIKPDNLNEFYEQCITEFNNFSSQELEIEKLSLTLAQCAQNYHHKAELLTAKRQQTANKLGEQLTALIKKLHMEHAAITISLVPGPQTTPNPHGNESCVFLIKTNADQNIRPLSQGTSGGELSRVALAVQVATAQIEGTPSLIFDEVDVGIGGGTAEIVGKLLRKMGKSTQVLCITHLAQVASQADYHIKVSKAVVNDKTTTNIEFLNKEERVAELARMIGGLTITKQTMAHASELLEQAQS